MTSRVSSPAAAGRGAALGARSFGAPRVGFPAVRQMAQLALMAAAVLLGAGEASGQQARGAQRGAAAQEASAQQADTLRARVLDRVQQLSRPLSRDSLLAEAEARRGADRDGRRGAGPDAAAPAMAPADSVMESLLRIPGYEYSQYEGRRADFEARDRRLLLTGSEERQARFTGDGAELEADSSIVYDDRTRRVRTVGATTLTPDDGNPLTSRTLIYDLDQQRGTAREARTEYREGANWIVWGELDSVDREAAWMSRARFTSCELDEPHYYFEAENMKVIRNDILVARSVRLLFDDVPVAWIPFMAQNLGSGRASGLLTPSFSVNDVVRTSPGYDRRISNLGYYWAMSDYSDAQLALDWFSNNYTALDGRLRYRWARRFLNGDIALRHFWRESGQRELTFNTQHSWEYSERTQMRASGRYASSSAFVREQSFDPREVTQSIDSEGGFSHRFDWGSFNVGANRKQYLTDDRVEMTLPTASLSLSSFTLFQAPPTQARWYNNLNVTGRTSFNRNTRTQPLQPSGDFRLGSADQMDTRGSASLGLSLGGLSLSNSLNFREQVYRDVPSSFFPAPAWSAAELLRPQLQDGPLDPDGLAFQDLGQAQIGWTTSLSYQQNFLGSSTFTPNVTLENRFARTDTIPEARDRFVAAPTRLSFGASVRTDVYGFFGGFGDYETIRHKITPNLRYSYAPEVTSTDLQRRVFGAADSRVRNQLTIGVNQTFEARVRPREDEPEEAREPEAPPAEEELPEPDPEQADLLGLPTLEDEEEETEAEEERQDPNAPRRLPRPEIVNLLGLQTSAVTYDIVQADSLGYFLGGVTTTRISNQITSDFLRGLTLSMEHDLFELPEEEGGRKRLAPHLSQMNFSFSMNQRSALVRWVTGLFGIDAPPPEEDEEEEEEEFDEEDPFERRGGPETSRMMPGESRSPTIGAGAGGSGWNAQISYSLRRPRETGPDAFGSRAAQMIRGTLSFRPTEHWNVSWRTSYDLEENRFLDHMVNLRRDLHDWEANFGLQQTVTGNWSFVFEVSLLANRDLRFDHRLRSRERREGAGLPLDRQ